MLSKERVKYLFLSFLIASAVTGSLMAWAGAPPDGGENAGEAVAESAGPKSGEVAAPMSSSTATPAPVQQTKMAPTLVGTAVVEGGASVAVFQSAKGTRLVREGDEISYGLRLVQVRRNRIDVERNGVQEEIRLGWSEGLQQQVRPAWMGGAPTHGGLESLWGSHKEKVQYRREMLARHRNRNLN